MYVEMFRTILFVIVLKATNVFKWRTMLAYLFISVFLASIKPGILMPERLLIYTSATFIAYILFGIAVHRISSRLRKVSANLVPRQAVTISIISIVSIYSIGYFFRLIGKNEFLSFFMTLLMFFVFGSKSFPKKNIFWGTLFFAAIAHSLLFAGWTALIAPAYYSLLYVVMIYVFYEARNAFSIACVPEELKEGMVPAESIVWDGKGYSFGCDPFPSIFGILRYISGKWTTKNKEVASFFVPLRKENIEEIKELSKKHKRTIFLVQKRIDFLPFLVLGAIMAYFTSI